MKILYSLLQNNLKTEIEIDIPISLPADFPGNFICVCLHERYSTVQTTGLQVN